MKINTRKFGELEYTEDKIIRFDNGIFGFEELKKYLFIKSEDNFFYFLNSIENPDISFPMMGIRIIDEEFPQEAENEAFGIVIMDPEPLKITVNLKAPVYINQNSKTGFQKIIDTDKYPVNFHLFVE